VRLCGRKKWQWVTELTATAGRSYGEARLGEQEALIARMRERENRGSDIQDGYLRDERILGGTKFELAPGEQPVVSHVNHGNGKPLVQHLSDDGPPRYSEEALRRLGKTRWTWPSEVEDDGNCASDEEEGVEYPVRGYSSYVAPLEQVHLSDTAFRLTATTTRTTKVFGVPVFTRTVQATDAQDWTGR
jgi:hypothetical protein